MVIRREYFYLGIGFTTVILIGASALLFTKSNPKIDLSKFDSPDKPGSGECMDKELLKILAKIQKDTGYPIFDWINSGARTPFWNRKVGGVRTSAHLTPECKATDIKTTTKAIQNNIVASAKKYGVNRIGIGKNFVHLDIDGTKKQYVAWGYPVGSPPPYNPFA